MHKHFLSVIVLLFAAFLTLDPSTAQNSETFEGVPRKPLKFQSVIQDKNFFLLSLIESIPAAANSFATDEKLTALASQKLSADSDCGKKAVACIDSALFKPEEIDLAKERLLAVSRENSSLRRGLIAPMRQSGLFELYASASDEELLSKAWIDAARGINRILNVYGKGQPPRYPQIDSQTFDLNSRVVMNALAAFSSQQSQINSNEALRRHELFFQPSLKLALTLLAVNKRDEAGRFEPLEGENAPALKKLPSIQWNKYRYSAIVVPGLGPEEPAVALDPGGFQRVAMAAKHYREGLAPYILVSGGNVHPSQTPFCEAIEMKKALVRDLGIPADSILIEPHARHTTTNFRNASRLLYRDGLPLDRPILVTTDEAQTHSIVSAQFVRRNKDELGYVPFRNLKPISPTDTEFNLEIESLQADSFDPLDP